MCHSISFWCHLQDLHKKHVEFYIFRTKFLNPPENRCWSLRKYLINKKNCNGSSNFISDQNLKRLFLSLLLFKSGKISGVRGSCLCKSKAELKDTWAASSVNTTLDFMWVVNRKCIKSRVKKTKMDNLVKLY